MRQSHRGWSCLTSPFFPSRCCNIPCPPPPPAPLHPYTLCTWSPHPPFERPPRDACLEHLKDVTQQMLGGVGSGGVASDVFTRVTYL